MNLFEHSSEKERHNSSPLADRMRPRSFEEYFGQEHLTSNSAILRKSIEADSIPSFILWGPPGSGKTTLAQIIAETTKSHFERISAVTSGVGEIRNIASESKNRLGMYQKRTILFVDEIHRLNKSQQDVALPFVENGTFILVGATTENPSFEIVPPLLSRTQIYILNPLTKESIAKIINHAVKDPKKGLGSHNASLTNEAMEKIIEITNGDARTALNVLEIAVSVTDPNQNGECVIDDETINQVLQHKSAAYDKSGEHHYNTISAFIKSVRGSDPDAAIYWLARMLDAGEDLMFIARRIVILAAEDIGLADPQALSIAMAAQQAVHFIGMPECRIPLAEATIYLAAAPKSNSAYSAINNALDSAHNTSGEPVPMHLRNAVTGLMKDIGYGKDYKYSHNYDDAFHPMQNLPKNLQGTQFYKPTSYGYEKEITKRLQRLWNQNDSKDQNINRGKG